VSRPHGAIGSIAVVSRSPLSSAEPLVHRCTQACRVLSAARRFPSRLIARGTESSNPLRSSRESVSRGTSPSHVEKRGFAQVCEPSKSQIVQRGVIVGTATKQQHAAIAAREDRGTTRRFVQHPVQKIGAGMPPSAASWWALAGMQFHHWVRLSPHILPGASTACQYGSGAPVELVQRSRISFPLAQLRIGPLATPAAGQVHAGKLKCGLGSGAFHPRRLSGLIL